MGLIVLLIKRTPLIFGFLFVIISACAQGCGSDADTAIVDFSKTVSVGQVGQHLPENALLRVAIASMVSPRETTVYYRRILEYIGRELNREIKLIQGQNYSEINALFEHGQVDLAFICSGPYATGKEKFGFDAIAAPQIRGKPFCQAYLIVQKDSAIRTFEDLRGRTFAFTDPESNTGSLVPRYWLKQMGETEESFFGKVEYTYAHDNSILAVTKSMVDGATVIGHVWEYYNIKKTKLISGTRIIKKSDYFGNPPIVASIDLPIPLKESIAQLLFTMHLNPEGENILKELMIDRFIEPKESWYDSIRQIKQIVNQ